MADYWEPYFLRSLVRGPLERQNGFFPAGYAYPAHGPQPWPKTRPGFLFADGRFDSLWGCPDNRTLLRTSYCLPGYQVGQDMIDFDDEDLVVQAYTQMGGGIDPATGASIVVPNPSQPIAYPPFVGASPTPLVVTPGVSVYNTDLAFDPLPDFMQVLIGWSPGEYGSYNDSCYIRPDGQRRGCGRSIFEHPMSTLEVEADSPWGLIPARGWSSYGSDFLLRPPPYYILPDEATGKINAVNGAFLPGAFTGAGVPLGQSYREPEHPAFEAFGGSSSFDNAGEIPRAMPSHGIPCDLQLEDLSALGDLTYCFLARDPLGDPYYDGEPENIASQTLWPYQSIHRIITDYAAEGETYGWFQGVVWAHVAFYWRIAVEPGFVTLGPAVSHYRKILGGRVGSAG